MGLWAGSFFHSFICDLVFCFVLFSSLFFRNVLLLHIAHLFITNIKKRTKVQRFGFIVLCFERWIPFVTCLKIVENRHNKIHRISTFMNEGLKCKCKILRKIKSTHTKHQAERARCQSQLKTDKCFNEKLKDHRTKVLEIMQMERLILIYANESSTYSVFVSLFLLLLFLHFHGFWLTVRWSNFDSCLAILSHSFSASLLRFYWILYSTISNISTYWNSTW